MQNPDPTNGDPRDLAPENSAPSGDVDAGVLATGCGWSCGLGCLLFFVLFVLATLAGADAIRKGNVSFLLVLSVLGSAAVQIAVGYFTARAAIEKKLRPNVHVIILGVIFMVIGLYSFIAPDKDQLPAQARGLATGLRLLSWIATIPLMLCGAALAEEE